MTQPNFKRFFLSIVMPSILAITLFILSIFVLILPSFEKNSMKGKKEMISELTKTVCSLLDEYYLEAERGMIPEDSAKALAAERIRRIRYGDELKDYFWIIDEQPAMIMHPYRSELTGKDLNDYKDPDGKLVFVESVQVVKEHGEGFINYMWQWKDDSTRTVPKLSYVKAFEPWSWIVGTGIYLEDVRLEISLLKRRLLGLTLLISFIISAILAFIIRQSLNIEKRRGTAERELRLSREKYKSLVEASTEGTLMWVDETFIFSNLKFSELSGYDPEEMRNKKFGDVFELDWEVLEAAVTDPKKSISRETKLRCKNGQSRDVVLSASKINHSSQVGFIIIVKEVSNHMQYEKESEHLAGELQTSLLMMSQPLSHISRNIQECLSKISIRDAASLMSRKQHDLLFIRQDKLIIGVVTNNDLVTRTLAVQMDLEEDITRIMSAPVITLPGDSLIYEGLILMINRGISHIAVTDRDGNITGSVGYREVAGIQSNMVDFLIRDIDFAETTAQIRKIYNRLPVLVKALIDSGSNTGILTRAITSMADAIHRRLIDLAIEELGPPPCRYAFMVMGSQGRAEQTLATDQDNAIIFENLSEKESLKAKTYFELLGKKVNMELDAVGYRYCPGEIMAGNPRWTQDLHSWKDYFSQWIRDSSPVDILDVAIFFDFRYIHGDDSLVLELRHHVNQSSENKSVFFYHMAQSVLKMKTDGAGSESLDLKKILLPVSNFIRLYAIREKISETNSMERAEKLLNLEIFDLSTFEEVSSSFNFLTHLRIKIQADRIAQNETAGNLLEWARLNRIETVVLKKLLADIKGLQTRLSTAFSGAES